MSGPTVNASWDARYAELTEFLRVHGHTPRVRVHGKLFLLGQWCNNQRYLWRQGKLTPDRVARLKALGLSNPTAKPVPKPVVVTNLVPEPIPEPVTEPTVEQACQARARRQARRRARKRQSTAVRLTIASPVIVTDYERLQQATRMVEEKMRPPLIYALLALPDSVMRKLWVARYGRRAPGGQLPMQSSNLLTTQQLAIHGAIYAGVYLQYAGAHGFRSMSAGALLKALDTYRTLMPHPCITGTMAWYIARDLRSADLLVYRTCKQCESPYLSAPQGTHLRTCPICASSK